MSEQGSRSRWSFLALSIILVPWGGLGCESQADASGAAASVNSAPVQTERVVQHMTPAAAAPEAAANTSGPGATATHRVVSSGVASGNLGAARAPEPITSRHLEAELNRLEAELAN